MGKKWRNVIFDGIYLAKIKEIIGIAKFLKIIFYRKGIKNDYRRNAEWLRQCSSVPDMCPSGGTERKILLYAGAGSAWDKALLFLTNRGNKNYLKGVYAPWDQRPLPPLILEGELATTANGELVTTEGRLLFGLTGRCFYKRQKKGEDEWRKEDFFIVLQRN